MDKPNLISEETWNSISDEGREFIGGWSACNSEEELEALFKKHGLIEEENNCDNDKTKEEE